MFDPRLFLDIAEDLKDSASGNLLEGKIRTSIGRSYYSIFLATRTRIEGVIKKDLENQKNVHEYIINNLKTSKDRLTAEYGTELDSLRHYRRQADYNIRVNLNNPGVATTAHKIADNLFSNLNKLPDHALMSQFKT